MEFIKGNVIFIVISLATCQDPIVSSKIFNYEEDMSDYCKRGVFKSAFLGHLTVDDESKSLLFNRQPGPFDCSVGVRTESGNHIIVVIKLTSRHAYHVARRECERNTEQLVVYPMGETFGNYWSDHMKPLMRYHNSTQTPPTQGYESPSNFGNTEKSRGGERKEGTDSLVASAPPDILLGEVPIARFGAVVGAPYASELDDEDLEDGVLGPGGPTAGYLTQVVDIATIEPVVLQTTSTEESNIARHGEEMMSSPEDVRLIEPASVSSDTNEVHVDIGSVASDDVTDDISQQSSINAGSTNVESVNTRKTNPLHFLDPWKLIGARRRNGTLVSQRTVHGLMFSQSNDNIEMNLNGDANNDIEITEYKTNIDTLTKLNETRIEDNHKPDITIFLINETIPNQNDDVDLKISESEENITEAYPHIDNMTEHNFTEHNFTATLSDSYFERNTTLEKESIMFTISSEKNRIQITSDNNSDVLDEKEISNVENQLFPALEIVNDLNSDVSTLPSAERASVLNKNTNQIGSKNVSANVTAGEVQGFPLKFRLPDNMPDPYDLPKQLSHSNASLKSPIRKGWFENIDEIRTHLNIRPMSSDKSWDNIVKAAPDMVDILNNRSVEMNYREINETKMKEDEFESVKDLITVSPPEPTPASPITEHRSKRHLGVIDIERTTTFGKRTTWKKAAEEIDFDSEEFRNMDQLMEPVRTGEIWQKIVLEPVLDRYIGPKAVSVCDQILNGDLDSREHIVMVVYNSRLLLSLKNFSLESILVVLTTARSVSHERDPCGANQRECLINTSSLCVSAEVACDGVPNCGSLSLYDEDSMVCKERDQNRLLLPAAILACVPVLLYVVYYWLRRCVPRVSEAFFVYTEQAQNVLFLDTIMRSPHDRDVEPYCYDEPTGYPEIELDLGEQEEEVPAPNKNIQTWFEFVKLIFRKKARRDKEANRSSLNEVVISNYLPSRHPGQNVAVQTGPSLEMGHVSSDVKPQPSEGAIPVVVSDETIVRLHLEENMVESQSESPLIGGNLRTDKRNDLSLIQFLKQRRNYVDAKHTPKVKEIDKSDEKSSNKITNVLQDATISKTALDESNSGEAIAPRRVRQIRFVADADTIVHEYDEDEESEDSTERATSAFRGSVLRGKSNEMRSRFERPRQPKNKGLKLKIRGNP